MTFRSREAEIAYKKHRKSNASKGCPFCHFYFGDGEVVRETKHFWIAKNIFGYSIWEGLNVLDHLLITPKEHCDSLHHFTPAELKEYAELVAEYDEAGYSTYTRSFRNISKSIPHQHTHLMKLGRRHAKVSIYLQKPYVLWHW